MALSKADLETLVPEKSFVVFAQYDYRVASLQGMFIEIYDEEPHSLHTDLVLASSCSKSNKKRLK